MRFVSCCVLVPVLLITGVALIYWNNNRPVRIVVPTPVMPNPNAYDDFVLAGSLSRGMKHKSPYSVAVPVFTLTALSASAKDAQPAISALKKGLGHEYLLPPQRSARNSRVWQVFALFRELARTESGVATYYEMAGKPYLATETRLDALEMGVTVPRGGALIAGLVGIACEAIASSQLDVILPQLSEVELSKVAMRLEKIQAKRVSFADVLQEEGYAQVSSDVEMINDPKGYRNFDTIRSLLAEDDPNAAVPGTKKPLTVQQNWDAVRFALADKSVIIRDNQKYTAAVVAEARRPYTGVSKIPIPNNLLSQLHGGFFAQSRARFTSMEAAQAVIRGEVALYRYRKARGRFPNSLGQLSPEFVRPNLVRDPFSRGPLRYRSTQNGTGFLLYSIGPDMKDDLGAPSRFVGTTPGDIVAGRMWRRRNFNTAASRASSNQASKAQEPTDPVVHAGPPHK